MVIPAKAGIQSAIYKLGPGLCRGDAQVRHSREGGNPLALKISGFRLAPALQAWPE